ncbi:MAG: hypothetical protein EAZ89_18185 [Bacteroidetes bacterium]|nr:MAG: hypothetical protein EAZ89_18185 [Bacteroidota bacterium]
MLRRISLQILLLALSASGAYAQLANRLVPHMGFMYELATARANTVGASNQLLEDFYNFHIGSYVVLAHKNDVASVGIDPSVQLGFNVTQIIDNQGFLQAKFNYSAQIPVFAMGRIGAGSTPYNQQPVGLGLGIGGNYLFFSQQIDNNFRRIASYVVPSAVAELNLMTRGNFITARIHAGLAQTSGYLVSKNIDNNLATPLDFKLGNFGLGLIYGF